MHVITARNVSQALPMGLEYLLNCGVLEESRAGQVLVAPCPVTTVYNVPTERVMTSAVRDANPFFHLAEIAWMLAGRDDAKFLNNFVADFGARFAESASGKENWEQDGRIHGAYGHRWRLAFGVDQLNVVVDKLRSDPTSRQCVIQMWDSRPQLSQHVKMDGIDTVITRGCADLQGVWKDRPCNTHAYLRIRRERGVDIREYDNSFLDLTVCCRSNDIVWGAYGANAVHFSALQEYLAARIGVRVGAYYQISNNFHAYTSEIANLQARADKIMQTEQDQILDVAVDLAWALRDERRVSSVPLVSDPDRFDLEIRGALMMYENYSEGMGTASNRWVSGTLWPALRAHRLWKTAQKHSAVNMAETIESEDWRAACVEWMQRRKK